MAQVRNVGKVRLLDQPLRFWRFTPETWWRWHEARAPNARTKERQAGIQEMRRKLRMYEPEGRLWKDE